MLQEYFFILPNTLTFFFDAYYLYRYSNSDKIGRRVLEKQHGEQYLIYKKQLKKTTLMEHKHKYDAQGKQLAAHHKKKKYIPMPMLKIIRKKHHDNDGHNHEHTDDDGHNHGSTDKSTIQMFLPAIISFVLLMIAIAFDNWFPQSWFTGWVRIV